MRSRYPAILICALTVILIFQSQIVRTSIGNSLQMCIQILIPSLFPFFVLSGMILDFGIDLLPPAVSAFLIGQFCGFPLGTRTVSALYQQEKISQRQAEALLMCTANLSPAFIVMIIGETILENKTLGYILLLCQSICSLMLFIVCVSDKNKKAPKSSCCISLSTSLIQNTKTAVEQILFVCGMTIMFGLIFDLLLRALPQQNAPTLLVAIELLHGVALLSKNDLIYSAGMVGFSGVCAIVQCMYFADAGGLRTRFLIIGKLLYSLMIPSLFYLFVGNDRILIILAVFIIILTNVTIACIIRHKGCEINDFFKRNRKMLCLLRTRH